MDVQRKVDAFRWRSSEVENTLIDDYSSGKMDRREFVRRGTVLGMSLTAVSFLASACGSDDKTSSSGGGASTTGTTAVKPGGVVRTGVPSPTGAIDPVKLFDQGGLAVLGQSGEYLVYSNAKLQPVPELAESWKPNRDGSAWTFKIRPNAVFTDGQKMTADDVVATFDRLVDPKEASQALSAFEGVLSPGNIRAVDATTIEFSLDAPNGSFPYLVSSDNYNSIILPKSYDGDWEKTFVGTGPWKRERFTPKVGVTYVKNPDYWNKERQPNPDTNEIKFYDKEQAQVLALQGGEVDALSQYSVAGGKALLTDPQVNTIELRSSAHRLLHMRTDKEPFTDKRVRQAVALLIDRKALVDGLFEGKADIGNDSTLAPVYPSTDKSVPQRQKDLAKAKELLQAAGQGSGFTVQLDTLDTFEIPQLAQLVQNDAKAAGITIQLKITNAAQYYGDSVFGKSTWLDSTMGITDYGHRGVPNTFLGSQLTTKGIWNASHFKNEQYDKLVADYIAALDVDSQRTVAKQIQELLLDETPAIIPYFYYFLTAEKQSVTGVSTTAMGHVDVDQAGLKA